MENVKQLSMSAGGDGGVGSSWYGGSNEGQTSIKVSV